MSDVFTRYQNLLTWTLDVVVLEWALDLNIGMENLSFCNIGVSIVMHCCYLKTLFYVPMICAIF
jgi:hypothetical protein